MLLLPFRLSCATVAHKVTVTAARSAGDLHAQLYPPIQHIPIIPLSTLASWPSCQAKFGKPCWRPADFAGNNHYEAASRLSAGTHYYTVVVPNTLICQYTRIRITQHKDTLPHPTAPTPYSSAAELRPFNNLTEQTLQQCKLLDPHKQTV